ncbi:MAG: NAD-dependent deacylase [Acidobacteriota bacterium]
MKRFSNQELTHAAELLGSSRVVVALTGAGISVASGIPDFRSPTGLWSEFDPMEYATIEAFIAQPQKVWRMFQAVSRLVEKGQPNPAHKALAALEQAGRLHAVITQNIDGLHQSAGSKNVIELHGTGRLLACPECGYSEPTPPNGLPAEPPLCPHAALNHRIHRFMKPDVVLFGEQLKLKVVAELTNWQNSLDLLLVVGTSAEVFPAAALPHTVKALGACVIEINTEPTRITNSLTNCFLQGNAEIVLPALAQKLLG